MMKRFLFQPIFGLLLVLIEARNLNSYGKFFRKCSKDKNAFECFKTKFLEIIDKAIKDESIYVLNDFLSIGKDTKLIHNINNLTPENITKRSLGDQLDIKLQEYLNLLNIELTIPGETFDGRGKKDKKASVGAIMMGGIGIAGILAQLTFGKIVFLAGTALLIAKIALIFSAIIGLKKLIPVGGHEIIYATASEHHSGGYGDGWQ